MRSLLALILLLPLDAPAAQWSGYATVASDNVSRGVSLIEYGPALQAGGEVRVGDVAIGGAWAARAQRQWWLYDDELPGEVELGVYAGADFALASWCRARATATRYLFPGSSTREWNELAASVAFAERAGVSFAWSPHGLGSTLATRTTEAWFSQPIDRATSVELSAGDVSIGAFDYWYARLGVSRRIGDVVVDLAYHAADPDLKRFGFDEHSRRAVLSVSTAW